MRGKHLTERMAAAYAAGTCGEAVELAAAAHLTFCPACRAKVDRQEAFLGALMYAEAPVEEPGADILARLEGEPIEAPSTDAPADAGPLPRVVADRIGVAFDEIPWRTVLPGVAKYEFIDADGENASLMRVKPGAVIPSHTHEAEELTVVFDGVLEDGDGAFGVGQISVADGEVDHHPRAGGDTPCVCLAVLTGGVTFTGRFGRILNLFA